MGIVGYCLVHNKILRLFGSPENFKRKRAHDLIITGSVWFSRKFIKKATLYAKISYHMGIV